MILLSFPFIATAGTIQLPQTGQTTCYDSSGTVIDCPDTGQDGDIKAGVAWPSPRFTVSTDGYCVTDNLTGLMWVRSPDSVTRAWQQALDYANGLSLCGYTDWRLPNVLELESLINAGQSNTATWLNTQGFSNVQSDYYWSSTSYADYSYDAWIVDMWYGYMSFSDKSGNYYVWPVRSGQVGPLVHSIIGQVTENSAGLGGVAMTLSGAASGAVITAADGTYSFTNLVDGSYTVTPSKTGYNFNPPFRNITMSGTDVTGQDFSAYPATGSIIINGGAIWANTTSVALTLNCSDTESGCSQMRLSNDKVTWSSWEAYNITKSWILSSGDGTKRVYVRYKDKAGNISPIYSDSIKLDTTKPVLTGVSDTPDPFKPGLGEMSTISFTASDSLSGTCTIRAKIYNASSTLVRTVTKSGVSCPSGGAAGSIIWNGRNTGGSIVSPGTYTYKLQARDKALNWSAIRIGTTTVE